MLQSAKSKSSKACNGVPRISGSYYVKAVGRRRGVRCRLTQVCVLCKIVEVFEELARSRDVDDLPIVPNLCRVRRNLGQFDEPPFSIVGWMATTIDS